MHGQELRVARLRYLGRHGDRAVSSSRALRDAVEAPEVGGAEGEVTTRRHDGDIRRRNGDVSERVRYSDLRAGIMQDVSQVVADGDALDHSGVVQIAVVEEKRAELNVAAVD